MIQFYHPNPVLFRILNSVSNVHSNILNLTINLLCFTWNLFLNQISVKMKIKEDWWI
jgi:hypothetical protein